MYSNSSCATAVILSCSILFINCFSFSTKDYQNRVKISFLLKFCKGKDDLNDKIKAFNTFEFFLSIH